jgi:hypothetical protein
VHTPSFVGLLRRHSGATAERRRISSQLRKGAVAPTELYALNKGRSTLALNLLIHDLDLVVDDAGETVDRYMYPVMFESVDNSVALFRSTQNGSGGVPHAQ